MSLKITAARAKELGIPMPEEVTRSKAKHCWDKAEPGRIKANKDDAAWHKTFASMCEQFGLPIPTFEYEFASSIGRKWRFDVCFDGWLALEIDGSPWAGQKCKLCGQHAGGRHNRGKGYIDDMEKLNRAAIMGWAVLRTTWDQVESGAVYATLLEAMQKKEEQP